MTEYSDIPSATELRAALAALFPDQSRLEQAIQHFSEVSRPDGASLIDGVDLDLQRQNRCGFPEVIFGEGKSTGMIVKILQIQQQAGQDSLVTRIRPDQVNASVQNSTM
ncbi:MAG: hypothetical protein R3C17_14765 [Planctomycetaceae bacterium]